MLLHFSLQGHKHKGAVTHQSVAAQVKQLTHHKHTRPHLSIKMLKCTTSRCITARSRSALVKPIFREDDATALSCLQI